MFAVERMLVAALKGTRVPMYNFVVDLAVDDKEGEKYVLGEKVKYLPQREKKKVHESYPQVMKKKFVVLRKMLSVAVKRDFVAAPLALIVQCLCKGESSHKKQVLAAPPNPNVVV